MISSEYSAGSGFATANHLQRLHGLTRSWLCDYGDRQFLDSAGVITAMIPQDTLEAGAEDACALLGLSGDMTLRYSVAHTEPVPGDRFATIHHADQTAFSYPVTDSDMSGQSIVERECVYVGAGYGGMFGVREKTYLPEFAHLTGSLHAPRALDYVDGSIIDGRVTDPPDMSIVPDVEILEDETIDVRMMSLQGVKKCFRRVRDAVLILPETTWDDEIREVTGPTADELLLEIAYDSIRISTEEASALEALVGTVSTKNHRRQRRLAL